MNNEHEELGGQVILSISASSDASGIGSTPEEAQAITSSMFSDFINQRNTLLIKDHGDTREKEFESLGLLTKFPKYQEVWRLLITPATNRLHEMHNTSLRGGISDEVLLMCQFHYTVMSATLRSKKHMDSTRDGSFFDFFCSMQNACEQAELFMLTHQIVIEDKFDWKGLLSKTDNLKNDTKRIKLLDEEFGKVMTGKTWDNFKTVRGEISAMRNALVHGPEIATYLDEKGSELLPRISKHKELLWTEIPESRQMEEFFKDQTTSMSSVLNTFMTRIDEIWSFLVSQKLEDKIKTAAVFKRYGIKY